MRFSVCIPNYNYARYLGRTVTSVLSQEGVDVEVVISDNASTDGSVQVVEAIGDPRVRVRVNACNVGFAGNLDRAASLATGDRMVMLSSDDLMRPGALAAYERLGALVSPSAVLCASEEVIDAEDVVTGRIGPDSALWREDDLDAALTQAMGAPVHRVGASELLRRSLRLMRNPLNFAAACYPRALYARVEGYGGGRLINPDKWFHWRLLDVADEVVYLDRDLFAYRWHACNQTAAQQARGVLKYMVDEYVATFELDEGLLEKAGLRREDLERAFVEQDVARHGLATLGRGDARKARRILDFGLAAYPEHTRRSPRAFALRALLAAGPVGRAVAGAAYRAYAHQRGYVGPG